MIIAGEVSGDMHGAALVRAMRKREANLEFFGMGGPACQAEGVETFYDLKDTAVMGFVEVMKKLSFFRKVFRRMLDEAKSRKPDAIILIDYPGFNLRFAEKVHAMGFHVVYYICPQVWAWNRSRIDQMARVVDHLITIFPFEKDYFKYTSLRVDTVGHPLVNEVEHTLAAPSPSLPWSGEPHIALLPGSRGHVLERVLPIMWQAAAKIEARHPGASFIVATPSDEAIDSIKQLAMSLPPGPTRWTVVGGQTRHVLRQARAGLIASGTATIEASLMECPMVIMYRMAELTYQLSRIMICVDHIGMVNIVAGRRLCPELIQHAATPEALAEAIDPLLADSPTRASTLEGLRSVNRSLGRNGSEQAAGLILAGMSQDQRVKCEK